MVSSVLYVWLIGRQSKDDVLHLSLNKVICPVSSQMDDSEGTVKQIGAFSEEINNLTVRH